MKPIFERYEDVLQNIEAGIVATYRDYPALVDFDVIRALETLQDRYKAEIFNKEPKKGRFSDLQSELIDRVSLVCEWRVGRADGLVREKDGTPSPRPRPITIDEMLICLKRLVKSVDTWTKRKGKRGYLDHVSQYIP